MPSENGGSGLSGSFNSAAAEGAPSSALSETTSKSTELGGHESERITANFNEAASASPPTSPTPSDRDDGPDDTPPSSGAMALPSLDPDDEPPHPRTPNAVALPVPEKEEAESLTRQFNQASRADGLERDDDDPPPKLSLADGPKPPEYLQRVVMAEARRNAALERLRHRAMEKTREIEYNRNMTFGKDRDGPARG